MKKQKEQLSLYSIKKYTALLWYIFCIVSISFSAEITLRINGEVFTREYPKTLDEACELINAIADINNNADSTLVELKKSYDTLSQQYQQSLESSKQNLDLIQKDLDDLKTKNEALEKLSNKIVTYKNTGTVFLGYNTVFDLKSKTTGHHIGIGFDYRVWRELHFGLNLGGIIYSNTGILVPQVGIMIGYSVF